MSSSEQLSGQDIRLYFLDNLRTFLIFLVIALHAGITYESSGWPAFFWIVDDPSTNDLSGLMNMILDIFIMPGMFFIAGYFTPPSLGSRTKREFIVAKLRRIMLPWLIAVLTLVPAYKFIFLYSRGLEQEPWTNYFHFSNGVFSQSWLWFLPILFMFYLLYLALDQLKWKLSGLSFKHAVCCSTGIGIILVVLFHQFEWEGWTKIIILDFQNERLPIYFIMFLLGALGFKREIFARPMEKKVWLHVVNGTSWIPIMFYMTLILLPYIKEGASIFSPETDRIFIRVSYIICLLALLYSTINVFRVYLNKTNPLLRILNRNAYGVYILHLIVLGVIATLFLGLDWGSKSKYLLLILLTFIVSNLLVSGYRYVKGRLTG